MQHNNTPLILAACNGYVHNVNSLVAKDTNIEIKSQVTPLPPIITILALDERFFGCLTAASKSP